MTLADLGSADQAGRRLLIAGKDKLLLDQLPRPGICLT
jgi:hypothetical protein